MSRVFQGEHRAHGSLFAAVDGAARYVTSKVQGLRFASLLTPFPDETAARSALVDAGASDVWEYAR